MRIEMITRINKIVSRISMISKPVNSTPHNILFHSCLTSYFSFPRSLSAASFAFTTRHSVSEGKKSDADTTVSKKAAMAILTTNIFFQWWSSYYWGSIWKKEKNIIMRKFLILNWWFIDSLHCSCFCFIYSWLCGSMFLGTMRCYGELKAFESRSKVREQILED